MSTRTEPSEPLASSPPPAPVGAVVLGGDYQGLGIARSLGRRGIPVLVVDDEVSISRVSRYVREFVRVPDLRGDAATIDALTELARTRDVAGWVLFPTRDETVAAISRNRETLTGLYRVPTPGWASIRSADDKRETYRLAEELDIPVPLTDAPGSLGALDAVRAPGPWAIKPAIKEHFFYETRAKAWRADDRAGLADAFARAARVIPADEVLVQELIPGDGRHQVSFCALCDRGRVVADMTVRRLRQHPPDFGRASTFAETVEIPELRPLATRFLEAIGYHGLAEVEFKHDPRDGVYKLLDVNARTWGYHTLGERAGVDFPYLLYRLETGRPVGEVRGRPGVAWMRTLTDLPTAIGEIRAGRLSVGAYLASIRRARSDAVFSLRDPLPGLMELALVPHLLATRGA